MQSNERDAMMEDLFKVMIRVSVALRIQQLEERGGPNPDDIKKIQESSDMLGAYGDILIHGGGKRGQRGELFNRAAHAVAVLSFAPGNRHIRFSL